MKRKLFKEEPGLEVALQAQTSNGSFLIDGFKAIKSPSYLFVGFSINTLGLMDKTNSPLGLEARGKFNALTLAMRNSITSRRTYSSVHVFSAFAAGNAIAALSIATETMYQTLVSNKNPIPNSASPEKLKDLLYNLESYHDVINSYVDKLPVSPFINEVYKVSGIIEDKRTKTNYVFYPQHILYLDGISSALTNFATSDSSIDFTMFNSDYNIDFSTVNQILSTVDEILSNSEVMQAAGDLIRLGAPKLKAHSGKCADLKQACQTCANAFGMEYNGATSETYWDALSTNALYALPIHQASTATDNLPAVVPLHLRSQNEAVELSSVDLLGIPANAHYQGLTNNLVGVNAISIIGITSYTYVASDDVTSLTGDVVLKTRSNTESFLRHNSLAFSLISAGLTNSAITEYEDSGFQYDYTNSYLDDEYTVYPVTLNEIFDNWRNEMLDTFMFFTPKSDKNFKTDSKSEQKNSKNKREKNAEERKDKQNENKQTKDGQDQSQGQPRN